MNLPRIGDTANIGMPYGGSVKARCGDIRIYLQQYLTSNMSCLAGIDSYKPTTLMPNHKFISTPISTIVNNGGQRLRVQSHKDRAGTSNRRSMSVTPPNQAVEAH